MTDNEGTRHYIEQVEVAVRQYQATQDRYLSSFGTPLGNDMISRVCQQ